MPRYFFDLKNGTRMVDRDGLDCVDDHDAILKGEGIARGIERDSPADSDPRRHVAVINDKASRFGKYGPDHADSLVTLANHTPCAGADSGATHFRGVNCSSSSAIVRSATGSRSPSFTLLRIVSASACAWDDFTGCGSVRRVSSRACFISPTVSGPKEAFAKSFMEPRRP